MSLKQEPDLDAQIPPAHSGNMSDGQAASTTSVKLETVPSDGNKRKADPAAADSHPADPLPKRTRLEESQAGPGLRAPNPPPFLRSADFWFPDGNVVVLVVDTVFKLYKARLARFSTTFAAAFANEGHGAGRMVIDGCPVHALPDVNVEDFTRFLEVLETPLALQTTPFPQDAAISVLRISHKLDCVTTRTFAVERLRALWPSDKPPLPAKPGAYTDALKIIRVARDCEVDELKKAAFYELIRSEDFWAAYWAKRDEVHLALTSKDIIVLQKHRRQLESAWFQLIFTPPGGKTGCVATKEHVYTRPRCSKELLDLETRSCQWRGEAVGRGDFDAGRADPLGHLQVLLTRTTEPLLDSGWCERCVEEARVVWRQKQNSWWNALDQLFARL